MTKGDYVILLAQIEQERRDIREKTSDYIGTRDSYAKRVEEGIKKIEQLDKKFEDLLLEMFQNKE